MTGQEWDVIVALITANWPHSLPPNESFDKWGEELADLDGDQVYVAVETIARDGRDFPPYAGHIRREVTRLTLDAPDWGDVEATLYRCSGKPTRVFESQEIRDGLEAEIHGIRDELAAGVTEKRADELRVELERAERDYVTRSYRDERAEAIAAEHPLVRVFVARLGWRQIVRGLGGGNEEARLRDKWLAFLRGAERTINYAGLPTAGLPALERAESERGDEPRRIGSALRGVIEQASGEAA
jgi:hypothetical protein